MGIRCGDSTNGNGGWVWYFPCACRIYPSMSYEMRDSNNVNRVHTSKKFIPALYTSTSTSSGPTFGSGASRVSDILEGCAYSLITKARISVVWMSATRTFWTGIRGVHLRINAGYSSAGNRDDRDDTLTGGEVHRGPTIDVRTKVSRVRRYL